MNEAVTRSARVGAVLVLALALGGCSIKTMAINTLGNALSEGTSGFAKDDDPELIRDAVPFALKTIETLIDSSPKHKGLLTAACSGFTQYGYAFIQQEADYIEAQDLDRATAMRTRAKKMYLRALDYGLRAFEVDDPGLPRRGSRRTRTRPSPRRRRSRCRCSTGPRPPGARRSRSTRPTRRSRWTRTSSRR